jgi:outer membrane lipoprotein LolB
MGLFGCATVPDKLEGHEVPVTEWFDGVGQWRVTGRVALSDGETGGQMGMSWAFIDGQSVVDLRTRFGGEWWRLSYTEGSARLDSHQGPLGVGAGQSPDLLVARATGWPIPVKGLEAWIRGLPSPNDEAVEWDAQGRMARLWFQGWQVSINDYTQVRAWDGRVVMLPSRLEMVQPPYRMRVVLGQWEWPKSGLTE